MQSKARTGGRGRPVWRTVTLALAALAVLQVPACTGLHRCHTDSGADCAAQIRTWSRGNPTWLVMADSTRVAVSDVAVGPDSVRWRVPKTMAPASAARDSVLAVHIKRRGKGAGRGLGFGLLGGVTLGALLGYSQGDDFIAGRSGAAIAGGVILGGVSGLGGLIGGAMTGYLEVFELGPPAAKRVPPEDPDRTELFATGG